VTHKRASLNNDAISQQRTERHEITIWYNRDFKLKRFVGGPAPVFIF